MEQELHYPSGLHEFAPLVLVGLKVFPFCPVACLLVKSSMLWCCLRFPSESYVWSVTPICFYLRCVFYLLFVFIYEHWCPTRFSCQMTFVIGGGIITDIIIHWNSIGGIMVGMLDSNVIDHGHIQIGICCFSAKHAGLRSKGKDWLVRNQNVLELYDGDYCFSELAL